MTRTASELISAVHTDLLIGGSWTPAESGKTFAVENPATGEQIATVADGGAQDAQRAIETAAATQKSWAKTSPRERSEILYRAFTLITERADDIATIMTAEMGKPFAEAKGEVAYGAEFFRWFAEEAVRISGDHTTTGDGKTRVLVTKEPVGPCVLITPWNFPLAMGTRKIGPAIAAGCTMVFKPADLTPLTALALADILAEAGLPDGVLNIVTTSDAGAVVTTWMESGLARKVSFTGSTAVGKLLLKQASENVMKSSMELGGNAPFVVFDDADLDKAVEGLMIAKMRNMGEACTAANRIFVHRNVADEFAKKITARMGGLTVGDGAAEGTQVGPLVEAKARQKVVDLVEDAVAKGATIMCGGSPDSGAGYFYPPTVLANVSTTSEIMNTEIFGPVAALIPFDSEEEVVAMANDTEWGLVGYLYTRDIDRALRMSGEMEAGMIGLNTGLVSNPAAPFGGVKESGLGREGGRVGIEEFLETKYIAIPRT